MHISLVPWHEHATLPSLQTGSYKTNPFARQQRGERSARRDQSGEGRERKGAAREAGAPCRHPAIKSYIINVLHTNKLIINTVLTRYSKTFVSVLWCISGWYMTCNDASWWKRASCLQGTRRGRRELSFSICGWWRGDNNVRKSYTVWFWGV